MKNLTVLLICISVAGSSIRGVTPAAAEEKSGFDKAWNHLTLYSNKEARVIQKFALAGLAQLDSVWIDPEKKEKFNDVAWRRFRLGAEMVFLKEWVAHLEADFDLNNDIDEWYQKLTDAYIRWSPNNDLEIVALKQSAGFTLDGATSSKKLLTLERNNLTNNLWFTEQYFAGFSVKGKFKKAWGYKVGFFSTDGDPEFGDE